MSKKRRGRHTRAALQRRANKGFRGYPAPREPEVKTVMGCAWYRAEQWERLREISVDRDDLEETHAEWVVNAEETLRGMRKAGMLVDKVEVDVEELLAWCKARQLDVDGGARAKYAGEMLRQRDAGHGGGSA